MSTNAIVRAEARASGLSIDEHMATLQAAVLEPAYLRGSSGCRCKMCNAQLLVDGQWELCPVCRYGEEL